MDFPTMRSPDIVGVPVGTVMSRLSRARQQLAGLLQEEREKRMNCEEILTLLDAYFDNELDLAKNRCDRRAASHLRQLAAPNMSLRVALRSRLDDPDLRYAAPNGLADQIRKKLALSNRPTRRSFRFR